MSAIVSDGDQICQKWLKFCKYLGSDRIGSENHLTIFSDYRHIWSPSETIADIYGPCNMSLSILILRAYFVPYTHGVFDPQWNCYCKHIWSPDSAKVFCTWMGLNECQSEVFEGRPFIWAHLKGMLRSVSKVTVSKVELKLIMTSLQVRSRVTKSPIVTFLEPSRFEFTVAFHTLGWQIWHIQKIQLYQSNGLPYKI